MGLQPFGAPTMEKDMHDPIPSPLYRMLVVAAVVSAFLVSACQSMQQMAPQKPLYDRLGGQPAVTAVVDDFVGNVAADNRINGFFARTDIARLKKNLSDQICQGTGGPCTYTGRDMATAHKGMNITNAQFDALVEDLKKTLDKFKVPDKEQGELLAVLGPMKPQIVGQ
jgi:hemoglobin